MKSISAKGKKIMIIVAVCLLVGAIVALTVVFGGTAISQKTLYKTALDCDAVRYADRITPVFEEDGSISITTDRDLRILHLTDVHIGGGVGTAIRDEKSVKAVQTMVSETKPDLVIVTGDLAEANDRACNRDNGYVYELFADMMDKLGVYWTVAFGNHDSEKNNTKTRAELSAILTGGKYKYCIFRDEDGDVYGHGNTFINIKNGYGLIKRSIIVMDSNDYMEGGYDMIHDDQVEWYSRGLDKVNAYNKALLDTIADGDIDKEKYGNVKSLLFFHIPLTEYKYAIDEYTQAGNKSTADVEYLYGEFNEKVCPPAEHGKMFAKIQEKGSTEAMFVGHDHTNDIVLKYKGITLAYTHSTKKVGGKSGGTVVIVKSNGEYEHSPYSL